MDMEYKYAWIGKNQYFIGIVTGVINGSILPYALTGFIIEKPIRHSVCMSDITDAESAVIDEKRNKEKVLEPRKKRDNSIG